MRVYESSWIYYLRFHVFAHSCVLLMLASMLYILPEPIGVGGQGLVHRALWRGANVAVKTLKLHERGSTALLAEATALVHLQHPHIVYVCTTVVRARVLRPYT